MDSVADETVSVECRVIGGFALLSHGRTITGLPRKTRALIAFLAINHGRPVRRDQLAELLWGDHGIQQARHSLRQTLLTLRRDVPSSDRLLQVTTDGLTLHDGVVVDLRRIEGLGPDPTFADRAAAAAVCVEPLLAGFTAVTPDFDEWLRLTRERTNQRMLDLLSGLARDQDISGDHAAAVITIERMLRLDLTREDLHRRLMLGYARAGRPADAQRQFNTCVDILRRELDVEPSAQTVALAAELRGDAQERLGESGRNPSTCPAEPRRGPPWLAVLPFRALGEESAAPYLAAGVADDIVRLLATVREPVVVSLHASRSFTGGAVNLGRLGRELGVDYVLSGSVRRTGERIRLGCELADTRSGAVLWGGSEDIAGLDLVEALDAAVVRVVVSLVRRVEEIELRRLRSARPDRLGTYELTLRARKYVRSLERAQFDLAEPLLRLAIEADPSYPHAHFTLAEWHNFRIGQGWAVDRDREAAAVIAKTRAAIDQDGGNARALALLGHAQVSWQRDYEAALPTFDRALSAAPNEATAWLYSSPAYTWLGDGDEALRRAERALRLSPEDPLLFWIYHSLSLACFTLQRHEEAVHWGILGRNANPKFTANLRITAAALAQIGERRRAAELVQETLAIDPSFHVRPRIERFSWRDEWRRRDYGSSLIEAGFPA